MTTTSELRRLLIAVSVLLASTAVAQGASITVTGDADALRVEAEETPLGDVVVAVAAAVGSDIEAPEDLPETVVTGVYEGSLSEVLKALVPSADFVVLRRGGRIDVHFVDGSAPSWQEPVAEATPADPDDSEDATAAEAAVNGEEPDPDEPAAEEAPPARRVY